MSDNNMRCKCGAYSATPAAVRQMSTEYRAEFMNRIRTCTTCKKDLARRGES